MRKFLPFILLLALPFSIFPQTPNFTLESSDGEFAMELSRSGYSVMIVLMFTHATKFDYVSIERSPMESTNFTQCKYIGFNETANDSVIIKELDKYPLPATQEVFYRIKTITKEGISRTYPSVRLPAIKRSP